jgi:hypothetical protein
VYAVLHVGLVVALVAGIMLVGHGKVVPRHIRQLRKAQEANHFAEALVTKRCTHATVPWPVITTDGMLVAWLCEDCTEERDTFRCPPRKAKPISLNIPEHDHEWTELRSMDNWLVHRYCHCGTHYSVTSEIAWELDRWTARCNDGSKPTYNARPRW